MFHRIGLAARPFLRGLLTVMLLALLALLGAGASPAGTGALDAGFDPGAGATWTVFAVTLQPDGRVLVGGAFEAIDGTSRRGIARLWGDPRVFLPLVLRK